MFNDCYPITYLGNKKTLAPNPINVTRYRFQAKYRRYFVLIEEYDFGFSAIKYCDVKDKNDRTHAFEKIFNDGDAFKVISTCLHIMHKLWQQKPGINFAFYAVPRNVDLSELSKKSIKNQTLEEFTEKYKRSRFNIYEYAMLNLFPPTHFTQMLDYKNCIYLLVNKKQENEKEMIQKLADFLFKNHKIICEPTDQKQNTRPPRSEMTFG